MLLKKLLNQLTTTAIIAGTTYAIATPALAQFYFPPASIFLPMASIYESEDLLYLEDMPEPYTTFSSALEETGLLETLEQQELTVLVPTDEAFEALSPEIQEKLAEPENLKKVLQYHIVVGQIGEADIKRQAVATLLEQNAVKIIGVKEGDKIGVKLNEAKASEPLPANDGIIIPIDQVLIPPNL